MESVSWTADYLCAHMLFMAQREECRFGDHLMSCPKTEDGLIQIDDPDDFTVLLEARIASVLLSTAALEAYLGYYGRQAAKKIEQEDPRISLATYLKKHKLDEIMKRQPARTKRKHELVMDLNGDRPVKRFLSTDVGLGLEDKIMYFSLVRTKKMIGYKDGHVKKMTKIINLRNELLHPDVENAPSAGKLAGLEDLAGVFLHHPIPESLTLGVSASEEYVSEPYQEEHFMWELLHVYPPTATQEFIQYLHKMDDSPHHFISVQSPVQLVDAEGRPVTEPMKKYAFGLKL